MTFKESLSKLKLDLTNLVYLPKGEENYPSLDFQITPRDFLEFARQDIEVTDDKGIVNGLSNAKRAIDCQIDSILTSIGIDHTNLNKYKTTIEPFINFIDIKDDVGYKMKIIHGLNLSPSYLTSKARTLRHKLEHYYEKPSLVEVKECIDIADLFLRSVEGKFKNPVDLFSITDDNNYDEDSEDYEPYNNGYEFYFDPIKKCFEVMIRENKNVIEKIEITALDHEFLGMIRLMYSPEEDRELTQSFKTILHLLGHPIPSNQVKVTAL